MYKKAFDIKNLGAPRRGELWLSGGEKPINRHLTARLRPTATAFRHVPALLENPKSYKHSTRNFDARWISGSNPSGFGGN